MSRTRQATNPFECLPEEKLQIIKDDFHRMKSSDRRSFKEYLAALHEEDSLSPEEMLDIIQVRNSKSLEIFSSVRDLLDDLHRIRDGKMEG